MTFEYKVVPAPTRGRKARGVKTPADRFARALEETINELASEGWEYLRTDTLPAEERQGLTGRTTVYQNMLVFRRRAEASETAGTEPDRRAAPKQLRSPDGAEAPTIRQSLDTRIADEIAATKAPRLPSAGAAQEAPEAPVKAPTVKDGKNDVAAE